MSPRSTEAGQKEKALAKVPKTETALFVFHEHGHVKSRMRSTYPPFFGGMMTEVEE